MLANRLDFVRTFAFVALLIRLACPGALHAQLEPDGANDTNYTTLGSQFAGKTVWVEGVYQGGNVIASGILIDPLDVLTAGHFASQVSIFQVGNGANQSSPNATSGVQNVIVHPAYNGTGNSPDLAIVHLTAPIGNTTLSLQPVAPGQTLTLTGFGKYGTPSTGLSYDGALRAWIGTVDNNGMPGNVSTLYYDNVNFPGGTSQPGLDEPGSSGGGVYNSLGPVGMLDYSTLGTAPQGAQQFLDFAKSGVEPWIATNLMPYLVYSTAGTNLVMQWNGSFTLQSSTNVAGAFADITNAVSPYTNTTSAPQMFFRLRSN